MAGTTDTLRTHVIHAEDGSHEASMDEALDILEQLQELNSETEEIQETAKKVDTVAGGGAIIVA